MIGQLQVDVGSALQEMVERWLQRGKIWFSGLMPNTPLLYPQPLFPYMVIFVFWIVDFQLGKYRALPSIQRRTRFYIWELGAFKVLPC